MEELKERFLRLPEVLEHIPVSKSAWYDGVKTGRYPKGLLLTQRTRVYKQSEILVLLEQPSGEQAAE